MELPRAGRPRLVVCIGIGLAAAAYLLARSVLVPISHDEALTFELWMPRSYLAILGLEGGLDPMISNNHALGTALMKLSVSLLGPAEWALRLPNLLAGWLFLGGAFVLVRDLANADPDPLGYAFVVCNPFLLELFSCGRGYGVGLSLLVLGLLALRRGDAPPRRRLAGLTACGLAITANLVFAFPVAGLLLVAIGMEWGSTAGRWSMRVLARWVLPGLPALAIVAAVYGRTLLGSLAGGHYFTGGTRAFIVDTLPSVAASSLLRDELPGLAAVLFVILVIVLGALVVQRRRGPLDTLVPGALVAAAVLLELAHLLLQTRFPTDRAALPFTVLVALVVVAARRRAAWAPARLGLALLMAAFAGVSVTSWQLARFTAWPSDATTRAAFQAVRDDVARGPAATRPVTVAASWLLEPALNYYRVTQAPSAVARIARGSADRPCDYFVLLDRVRPPGGGIDRRDAIVARRALLEIARFPATDVRVYRAAP